MLQVGTVITKNNAAAELKPVDTISTNNAAGGKIEEEFTVARYCNMFSLGYPSYQYYYTRVPTQRF